MPECSTCTNVYRIKCTYEPETVDVPRRKTTSKRVSAPVQKQNSAAKLLGRIQRASEADLPGLLHQIRNSRPSIDAATHRLTDRLIDSEGAESDGSQESTEPHLQTYKSRLAADEDDTTARSLSFSVSPNVWTNVATDPVFIRHLIRLYFTWNAFYSIIDEEEFYSDLENGKLGNCSSLLVNAICAMGCHFTDFPAARADPQDPKTVGDHFFEAAKQQLFKCETPSLCTVQALSVMSVREISAGRDGDGFRYGGRAYRMAIEMNMHLQAPQRMPSALRAARVRTFWALFITDT